MTLLHRRQLVIAAAGLAAAAALPWRPARAQAAPPAGAFALPPLPYAADANEAAIDATTMEIHHGRHHAAYVANLNAALREHSVLAQMPLEELLHRLGELPEGIRAAVRNNGGGHANHSMFWEIMGGRGGEPSGALKEAIDCDLGGMEKFCNDFNATGARLFGSGWVFVTVSRDGALAIVAKPNQDTPLMDGGRVLMGNDVWEHAYYLRYQNRRADYLASWWKVVDWAKVQERFEAARAGALRI